MADHQQHQQHWEHSQNTPAGVRAFHFVNNPSNNPQASATSSAPRLPAPPPSASSSAHSLASAPYPRPSNKGGVRGRVTVVCAECKRLKLRCSRDRPCQSCIKRSCTDRCKYRNDADLPSTSSPESNKSPQQLYSTGPGEIAFRTVSTPCIECTNLGLKCDRREPCSHCKRDPTLSCVYPGLPPLASASEMNWIHARLTRLEAHVAQIVSECDQCRNEKLKCDGKLPCSWCVKRQTVGHCAFSEPPMSAITQPPSPRGNGRTSYSAHSTAEFLSRMSGLEQHLAYVQRGAPTSTGAGTLPPSSVAQASLPPLMANHPSTPPILPSMSAIRTTPSGRISPPRPPSATQSNGNGPEISNIHTLLSPAPPSAYAASSSSTYSRTPASRVPSPPPAIPSLTRLAPILQHPSSDARHTPINIVSPTPLRPTPDKHSRSVTGALPSPSTSASPLANGSDAHSRQERASSRGDGMEEDEDS